jgi:NADH-quinone oxidoreductase subunit M
VAPLFGTAFVITALASIGLPGTSGFVGEFLALLGTFETHPWIAGLAATGVIFAAYYMLPMVQSVWFNQLDKEENRLVSDLSRRELVILTPMVALMIWVGAYPTPLLRRMEPGVQAVLERVESGRRLGSAELGRGAEARRDEGGELGSSAASPALVADYTAPDVALPTQPSPPSAVVRAAPSATPTRVQD